MHLKYMTLIFMIFADKHAHSVWVNGQEVEVEVKIRVEISIMCFYVQQTF